MQALSNFCYANSRNTGAIEAFIYSTQLKMYKKCDFEKNIFFFLIITK